MIICIPQGLKAVDSSIKESDLPAADPNTPIPLKYDALGACAAESSISSLLERGQSNFIGGLPEEAVVGTVICTVSILLLNDWMTEIFFFKFLCLVSNTVTSGAIAGGPEAKNALGDDPWVMAASPETTAFPQSLQGLLRPV